MTDLLLTHGYFLYEDPKEMQILKPYVPLGLLYICSHLRAKGFDVDVFDTTFSAMDDLKKHLQTEPPSVLGIYANLMTRKKVLEILQAARLAGWKTVVGGPEPGAYVREYLEAGAEVVVLGEGEITMEELLRVFQSGSDIALQSVCGIAFLDESGHLHQTGPRAQISDIDAAALAGAGRHRHSPLHRHLAWSAWHGIAILYYRERLPIPLPLVQPPGIWEDASASQTQGSRRRGRMAASIPTIRTWSGLRTMFSRFTTDGCVPTRRRCEAADCTFPSNASRGRTV